MISRMIRTATRKLVNVVSKNSRSLIQPFGGPNLWHRSLVNLQQLYIWMDGVRQEDLCILGGLPALLKLSLGIIKCKDSPRNKVTVSGADGFRCLREFVYNTKDEGMDIMFAAGSMPKLEKLDIAVDAAKTESLSGDDVDFGIGNLPCLTTLECELHGPRESVEAAKAAMERASC